MSHVVAIAASASAPILPMLLPPLASSFLPSLQDPVLGLEVCLGAVSDTLERVHQRAATMVREVDAPTLPHGATDSCSNSIIIISKIFAAFERQACV